jgi:integrase
MNGAEKRSNGFARRRNQMSSGSIVKRGKESWRLKFDISPDPISGERRTRYSTFKGSKRDAQTRLAKFISEADDGVDAAPASLSVGEYIEHWLSNAVKPSVRANTYEGYGVIASKHLVPALGKIKLRKLSALHIQSYYTDKAAAGLSAQTVNHHHRLLFQALKHAYNSRLITFNPVSAVKPPKIPKSEIQVLSKDELVTLLDGLRGKRIFYLAFLAACTGMRRSELLGLRWCDVDIEAHRITVIQTLEQTKEYGLRIGETKTKSSRRPITLPPAAIPVIKEWKISQDREHLRLGQGRDDNRLVFTREDGEWYSPRSMSHMFSDAIKKIDIPRITLHGLRHTHITHLLRDNVNIKVVSARAGHSTVSITLDVYGHLIDNMESAAADVVESWFASPTAE